MKALNSENGILDCAGKEAYQHLKRTIQVLKMSKPPGTIPAQKLFDGIISKIDKKTNGQDISHLIAPSMILKPLTPMQMGT